MTIPVIRCESRRHDPLEMNAKLVEFWLVEFLKGECIRKRGVKKVVIGLSGGVDSAVVAMLAAKAFGPENVFVFRMPYKVSSPDSLDHAELVIKATGIIAETIPITDMVDGYFSYADAQPNPTRIGNICARCRTAILFDQSARLGALPLGTGNKTERLFGYFTWHADDAPPINPLGDLFKTQVLQLATEIGVPEVIIKKPPSADLIVGQTDEGDFGISYAKADQILGFFTLGFTEEKLIELGFDPTDVALVLKKVNSTHWKRKLPTVAMMSASAIGEYFLRPVDY